MFAGQGHFDGRFVIVAVLRMFGVFGSLTSSAFGCLPLSLCLALFPCQFFPPDGLLCTAVCVRDGSLSGPLCRALQSLDWDGSCGMGHVACLFSYFAPLPCLCFVWFIGVVVGLDLGSWWFTYLPPVSMLGQVWCAASISCLRVWWRVSPLSPICFIPWRPMGSFLWLCGRAGSVVWL